jgi:hypothetical protein
MHKIRLQEFRHNDITHPAIGAQSSGEAAGNADVKISVTVGHAHHKIQDVSRLISDTRKSHEDFRIPYDAPPQLEPFGILAIKGSAFAPGGEFGFDRECDKDAHLFKVPNTLG